MPSLILPVAKGPRRLLSFWLVVSLGTGLLASSLLSFLLSPPWATAAILLIPGLFLPVFLKPELAILTYRAWNKAARVFSHYARLFL